MDLPEPKIEVLSTTTANPPIYDEESQLPLPAPVPVCIAIRAKLFNARSRMIYKVAIVVFVTFSMIIMPALNLAVAIRNYQDQRN